MAKHTKHEGICTDCGRVLSEIYETFFGTMCATCKNLLMIDMMTDQRDG